MNLDFSSWRAFAIGSVFTISNGRGITSSEIEENPGTLNAVQSGEENNGVIGKISAGYCRENDYVFTERPCLTVARTGSAGFVSFQEDGCVVGDSAKILQLRYENASSAVYLFLQSILNKNRFKFSYGRKVTEAKYARDLIDLPVEVDESGSPVIDPTSTYSSEGYVPDWQFMEDFIKSLNHKPLTTENNDGAVPKLDTARLVDFNFGRLVSEVYKATAFTKDDLVEFPYTDLKTGGYVRYITRTALDNGCEMLVVREKDLEGDVEAGNAISIGDTTATCFYQPEDFVAGDHMVVVRAEWLNPFTGNFIATLLNRESYRYSYGRAFVMESIKATDLKLPIKRNPDGTPVIDSEKSFHDDGYIPDWQFMEDYMRSLPYGDRVPEVGD